jgi:tRNA nucleotidyltransferase (CCA-adding enzyme)
MTNKDFWMDVTTKEWPGNILCSPFTLLGVWPELLAMHGTPQDPEWHPEGDVARHTLYVTNHAAKIARRENFNAEKTAVLILSALLHDIAKSATTEHKMKRGVMRITSEGHEKAGGPMARTFLEKQGIDENIIAQVVPLVENHLAHIIFAQKKPSTRVLHRLKKRLEPSDVRMLAFLIEADVSGRPPLPQGMPETAKQMIDAVENLKFEEKTEPIIGGKELIELGVKPGPKMGEILKLISEKEKSGDVSSVEEAIEAAKTILKEMDVSD